MIPMRRMLATIAVLVGGLVGAARPVEAAPEIAVGEPFPMIVLPAADDGRPMSIADYRGRRVVLHVFASW